jgi:lysophospholipase L1-like esterase
VIEEGLNGRTATVEHPRVEGAAVAPCLLPCCRSHAPLDLVIIYLGTNDLHDRYHLSAAYQAKYSRRYPTIVPSIVTPDARAATLKLVPR